MTRLVLGSGSKWRQHLLKEMGYDFEVVRPDIDEKSIRRADPAELVAALAEAKSVAVKAKIKEPAIVLTSDQVTVCDGKILEKPADEAECREHIRMLGEFPAETVTSVFVVNTETGKQTKGIDIAKVWMRPIPAETVEALIVKGDVLKCSGGLSAEDPLVAPYIVKREGTLDSVMGLPKELTKKLINEVLS